MKIPTDPFELAIWLVSLALQGISAGEAFKRLETGISATAQAEGRDVTDEELALLKSLADASERVK